MKLLFAVVDRDDAVEVVQNLSRRGYPSTKLDSAGGFLMKENVTIMIGVDDRQAESVINTIREFSHERSTMVSTKTELGHGQTPSAPVEVNAGGATIFVVDVDRFEKV